jgi:centromeric protein E
MAVQDLFEEVSKQLDSSFLLRMSVIEIYNEEVRDLLSSRQQSKVSTRYDSNTGLIVETNELFVNNVEGIMDALSIVDENRVYKETDMNKYSSRSHVVFRFTLEKMAAHDGLKSQNLIKDEQSVQVSTLSLIDLAGSDASRLNSKKGNDLKKEGSNINKR